MSNIRASAVNRQVADAPYIALSRAFEFIAERNRRLQGVGQTAEVIVAWDFDGAEALAVGRELLDVEEQISPGAKMFDQGDQGDFRGVALVVEHRFGGEQTGDGDAVDAARQAALAPGLDAVGVAQAVHLRVGLDHGRRDPGAALAPPAAGATADHARKILVAG